MIYVGTGLKKEEIKDTLRDQLGYEYVGSVGIKLKFEHPGDDAATAVAKAKTVIKGTSYGKVLYFSVKDNELGI